MMRPGIRILVLSVIILGLAMGIGRAELSSKPPPPSGGAQAAQRQQQGELIASAMEEAFVKVAREVGPAVASISTEQIEQVQKYFRVHPFMGQEPFDELFRNFLGDTPQQREFKRFGLGSGVIIDERGYILTNEHVIADADKITVTLADGREFSGEVKGKDARADLAVIKIDAKKLPVAILGDSETLKTGQWAIAIGNPFGLIGYGSTKAEPTLTVGVISAQHRQLPIPRTGRDYSDLIQTDAEIDPGNSGGPLVNLNGEVIGINVAILADPRSVGKFGFAIPIKKAKDVLDALIEGRKVLYGWLGVQIQDITQDVAEYYGLADREGVLVYSVLPDGPAAAAGIKDGDIIKTFNGKVVNSARELMDAVGRAKVGQKSSVQLLRERKPVTVEVQIAERPADVETAEDGATEAWRGVRVAELTPQLAERFSLAPDTTGVVVAEVGPNSPAADAGLQAGDVINEINRLSIESLKDYRAAIAKVQGNTLVRTNRGYVVVKAGE